MSSLDSTANVFLSFYYLQLKKNKKQVEKYSEEGTVKVPWS